MLFPTGQVKVYLYNQATDMRKSYDALEALVKQTLKADPLNGALYVFINSSRNRMKILYFEPGGYCLWSKRLEMGRFGVKWRAETASEEMDLVALRLLIDGLEVVRKKPRFMR